MSAQPLTKLVELDAATWLDRDLVSGSPTATRGAGFGAELRDALERRRGWLIEQGLAEQGRAATTYRPDLIAVLERRELVRVAGQLAEELALPFAEPRRGGPVEGILRRPVDLVSGRFALIENGREFALVPWRPVLERQIGKHVSGIMRGDGISWSIGRDRTGPAIG